MSDDEEWDDFQSAPPAQNSLFQLPPCSSVDLPHCSSAGGGGLGREKGLSGAERRQEIVRSRRDSRQTLVKPPVELSDLLDLGSQRLCEPSDDIEAEDLSDKVKPPPLEKILQKPTNVNPSSNPPLEDHAKHSITVFSEKGGAPTTVSWYADAVSGEDVKEMVLCACDAMMDRGFVLRELEFEDGRGPDEWDEVEDSGPSNAGGVTEFGKTKASCDRPGTSLGAI